MSTKICQAFPMIVPSLNKVCLPYAVLLLSPPAKWLHHDVTMHAVYFWGQVRYLPVGRESALPVTKKERCKRGKGGSALEQNLNSFCAHTNEQVCEINLSSLYLTCPQKWTARIMTSRWSHFAGGLSNKKA